MAESRGAGWAAQSRIRQLTANITVSGARGWCRAESRETGWAGLVEVWPVSC